MVLGQWFSYDSMFKLQCDAGYFPRTGESYVPCQRSILTKKGTRCISSYIVKQDPSSFPCNGSSVGVQNTTCKETMYEGEACRVNCPDGQNVIGRFSCSLTYIVGNSSCSSDAGVVEVAVTKVSGGFNLDLDLGDGNITITPEHRTSVCTTLSGTLGMTLSQLTRCEVVLQSVPGGRRLDDGQEDFEVESFPRRLATVNASIDYEVVVAHTKAASDAARP